MYIVLTKILKGFELMLLTGYAQAQSFTFSKSTMERLDKGENIFKVIQYNFWCAAKGNSRSFIVTFLRNFKLLRINA